MTQVSDLNIASNEPLPPPTQLLDEITRNAAQEDFVAAARDEIRAVLRHRDNRLLAIVGPCSIHDIAAGLEYAEKLRALSERVKDRLLLVMRCYFEKPRTSVGWKGLIMDPHLDGSHDIPTGLRIARRFLRDVIDMGLPPATELLDPITPQYIADLVCWSAIGARTTESQTHRQMASGLSMPLGFKNATHGFVESAIHAIKAACRPQTFLGISPEGVASAVTTRGNPDCHIVLRGGDAGPNYGAEYVAKVEKHLAEADLEKRVVIDCSHGNSRKDPARQPDVLCDVIAQRLAGAQSIVGIMLESNLVSGMQSIPDSGRKLVYGQSITDGCLGWASTEQVLLDAAERWV
jgi:3-deoxy-7-phosphoheptulonate synthase